MKRAPSLLLSTESLLGTARIARRRTVETLKHYGDPLVLAVAFLKALEGGADGVLVSPSPLIRESLRRAERRVPTWALLPNVPAYVRDSSDVGLIGAALKRVRGASPLALFRLGLTGLTHAPGVLASDFAGMLPLLLELESAALGARALEGVVVAAPITDLALAGGHRRFFEHVVRFVHGRFRARAGFETHNLGHLLQRLGEWGVEPDLIIGPVNPLGFIMKPTPERTLAELAGAGVPVLAKQLTAGGAVGLEEGARFARSSGAAGMVADLAELAGREDAWPKLRAVLAA